MLAQGNPLVKGNFAALKSIFGRRARNSVLRINTGNTVWTSCLSSTYRAKSFASPCLTEKGETQSPPVFFPIVSDQLEKLWKSTFTAVCDPVLLGYRPIRSCIN